eukprot:scaffold19151_cov40-Tisochrysis_lutea.AAC.2
MGERVEDPEMGAVIVCARSQATSRGSAYQAFSVQRRWRATHSYKRCQSAEAHHCSLELGWVERM